MDTPHGTPVPQPRTPSRRSIIAAALAALALAMVFTPAVARAGEPRRPTPPLRIVVTIPPLMWAVKTLAPADAEITLILPPGRSEHGFEITPSQFKAINDADLVVMVGYDLEPKVESTLKLADRPQRAVVSFEDVPGANPIEGGHEGCDDPSHHHGYDPHLWLDPILMREFVARVGTALEAKLPATEHQRLRDEVARLRAVCDDIDRQYRERLAQVSGKVIVTHHNAYAYLARSYGLEVAAVIRPIEVVEPTPGDIREVTTAIRDRGLRTIFIEPQFSAKAAERIAETTGVRLLPLDPLGDGDWEAMMRRNLDALVDGLK